MVFLDCSHFTGSGVMEPAVSGEVRSTSHFARDSANRVASGCVKRGLQTDRYARCLCCSNGQGSSYVWSRSISGAPSPFLILVCAMRRVSPWAIKRTLRNNILSLAVGLSDEVPWSHRHERRIVYEHGTHRLPFRFTARGSTIPPSFRRFLSPACAKCGPNAQIYLFRVAYQLMYSVSYKLRAVIACPRFHPDLWTPKRAHPLTVLPCPRFQQVQHV